jgi:hypothetical protein
LSESHAQHECGALAIYKEDSSRDLTDTVGHKRVLVDPVVLEAKGKSILETKLGPTDESRAILVGPPAQTHIGVPGSYRRFEVLFERCRISRVSGSYPLDARADAPGRQLGRLLEELERRKISKGALLMKERNAKLQAIRCLIPDERFSFGDAERGVNGVDRPLMIGVRTGSIASCGSQWTFRLLCER